MVAFRPMTSDRPLYDETADRGWGERASLIFAPTASESVIVSVKGMSTDSMRR